MGHREQSRPGVVVSACRCPVRADPDADPQICRDSGDKAGPVMQRKSLESLARNSRAAEIGSAVAEDVQSDPAHGQARLAEQEAAGRNLLFRLRNPLSCATSGDCDKGSRAGFISVRCALIGAELVSPGFSAAFMGAVS